MTARIERRPQSPPQLVLVVADTGAGVAADVLARGRGIGVGLRNVERRLACQYGKAASLSIQSTVEAGTLVEIRLPAERKPAASSELQGVG